MNVIWKWLVELYLTSTYGRWVAVPLFVRWKEFSTLAPLKQEGYPVEYDSGAVYDYYAVHQGMGLSILCNDLVEAERVAAYRNGLRGQ